MQRVWLTWIGISHKSENNSSRVSPKFCLIFNTVQDLQSLCDFGREKDAIAQNRRVREIMQMITEIG